ncbi:protein BTR1 [Selaginella moellendorffii]|uniref:protein BTR1 n=1 Tax=Selaginella moellendorffii TaxID=88036 RepID=UPI000D1C415F|nr:protein BTR1 [Selaginella moellendorffii]XP_024542423.1 protein BTR1 [Selaginella moellendorffii]|eukprot:XP_024528318.1 protein BTR1 [Selaginella moellendorffii]
MMMERGMSPEPRGGSPKRARGGSMKSSSEDGNGSQSSARFLVSNAEAGSVIGKGGATISDLQSQSGARIQLSRSQDFFPGTTDRVVVLSGAINDVLTALNLILSKIQKETEDDSQTDSKPNQLRLVVPNSVCGAIIGKGGGTIKSFIEDSEASIKLSGILQGISDRLVTITGSIEQQLKAVELILTKLLGDSSYLDYAAAPLSYTGCIGLPQNRVGRNIASAIPSNVGPASKGMMTPILPMRAPYPVLLPVLESCPVTTSITLAVPDEHIGAIVGRGGKTLGEIQQASGVTIKISERGDFVSGTKNRKVTLVGTAEGLQIAQFYLTAKVQAASDRER